ncbi:hypothetical protein [Caballeronia temeraria]|uniref:hypothetical protein n=1 Tax=Caballeronia temeraria TaxID=1777137 RepID=UPI000B094BD8|nr:hypothetical protein [Caballeronia temeraria]
MTKHRHEPASGVIPHFFQDCEAELFSVKHAFVILIVNLTNVVREPESARIAVRHARRRGDRKGREQK